MRVVFMGSTPFGLPACTDLGVAGHEIIAVYTQPPRPAGRGQAPRPTPVQLWAETQGIQVRTPISLKNPEEQQAFADLNPDVAVVAAYGLILPPAILQTPPLGCLNLHASLLPRWRGAAPIQRAILANDRETGVAIMQMDAGLDTGAVRAVAKLSLTRRTAGDVENALAKAGGDLLVRVLADLTSFPALPQSSNGVTYAAKIAKEELRLNWSLPAAEVVAKILAFAPRPGAWFLAGNERLKVFDALVVEGDDGAIPGSVLDDEHLIIQCGQGAVQLLTLQRPGRTVQSVAAFRRGFGSLQHLHFHEKD
ncbi:MAG: methionyl-tRNA formyltransferase [Holosporales bacterium]|jgi:methionyl-tRNA formyltransferase